MENMHTDVRLQRDMSPFCHPKKAEKEGIKLVCGQS